MGSSGRSFGGAAALNVGTTAGTVAAGNDSRLQGADVLTAGEFVPRRMFITSSAVPITVGSGALHLAYFTADKTESVATVTAYTGATAAAATPTLCRMGVYSVAANGDLTLVGSHANDTTLFAATFTAYPKALTSSFTKTVGQRYAAAVLVVSGAAMPTFHGWNTAATGVLNTIVGFEPALAHYMTGQTDLPASITAASLTGATRNLIAMRLS